MKHQKRILSLILVLALCLSLSISAFAAGSVSASRFLDFDQGAWYAEAVEAAVQNGLLYGKGNGRLDPNGYLTRAEMAAIINRAFGCYKTADISRFRDVAGSKWYYRDVQLAYQMGTFVGDSGGTMRPDDNISRQEIFAVVCRALQLDTANYNSASLSRFSDVGAISDWALPYIRAMSACGYVNGRPGGLAPKDNITRAEFCQLFANVIQHYLGKGVYQEDITGNVLAAQADTEFRDMTISGDLFLGNGVGDGKVTLTNVTVKGRLVVWGGGIQAVYCDGQTYIPSLVVCRVDGAVKVIFDQDASLLCYDKTQVRITDRAKAFPETEVIFTGFGESSATENAMDEIVNANQISVSVSDHIYGLVDETELQVSFRNESKTDLYQISVTRNDNGEQVGKEVELMPGRRCSRLTLDAPLPFGNYECTVQVTALRDGEKVGSMAVKTMLHIGYLWSIGGELF